jgi:hypothetical protein
MGMQTNNFIECPVNSRPQEAKKAKPSLASPSLHPEAAPAEAWRRNCGAVTLRPWCSPSKTSITSQIGVHESRFSDLSSHCCLDTFNANTAFLLGATGHEATPT